MSTILIGGGSGLIGTTLSEMLTEKGHKVIHLSRKQNLEAKFPKYAWDLKKGTINMDAINQADYIINLAGAGVADQRWTDARKKEIINSRVDSTLLIKKAVEKSLNKPKAIIAASAIGYYGDRGAEILKEDSSPGDTGFLPESTRIWENAISELTNLSTRIVKIRIGIVLSTQGGALKPFILQDKFRLGSYFGNGEQFYSWVHIEDLCRIFIYAIENENIKGTFNGVGPNPVSLYNLVKGIAEAQNKSVLMLPVPAFMIKLGMGEMAEIVLSSTRVSSEKIVKQGFKFNYPELTPAIQNLLESEI